MHLTPAGLPFGIPGIEVDIEGAMQQAPQPSLQFIVVLTCFNVVESIYFKKRMSVPKVQKLFCSIFIELYSKCLFMNL